ncbi:MAG: dihydroneopterin aldolase [Alphaproteobacteria bacterium]|nr:dihydroneopterin aldolase [Alphaproteobacteria bacterium]
MLSTRKEPHFSVDFEYDEPAPLNQAKRAWSIVIQDLLIRCKIGVYPHELGTPQDVLINLECNYLAPLPQPNTDTSQVLCYATLAKDIETIANKEHIYFIENFAETIADHCLSDPRVQKVKISAMKMNALDTAKSVGVKITRSKQTKTLDKQSSYLTKG